MASPEAEAAMWCGPSRLTGSRPTGAVRRTSPVASATALTVSE
ncbi:MAG: hypothetical protein R3F14_14105 [Polyangiaceae bacterium]